MPPKGTYLKIDGLPSWKAHYYCPVCLSAHAWARNAAECCRYAKPVSPAAIEAARLIITRPAPEPRQPTPRTKKAGDGTRHPDKWGHWRRGKKRCPEQTTAEINKARARLDRQRDKDVIAALERIYPSYELVIREDRSPLQRLAYAFHNHNWENVKQAYIDGINEAVRNALAAYLDD